MNIETNRALQLATARAFKAVMEGSLHAAVEHVVEMGGLKGTGSNVDGIHHWLKEACRLADKATPTRAEVVRILQALQVDGAIRMQGLNVN